MRHKGLWLLGLLTLWTAVPDVALADGDIVEYVGKEKDIHPMLILAEFLLVAWGGYKLSTWFAGLGRKK